MVFLKIVPEVFQKVCLITAVSRYVVYHDGPGHGRLLFRNIQLH